MDQTTRNRLRNVVTQCRRLLEESIAQQLQGKYDIYATGKKDEVRAEKHVPLGHLSDEERQARQDILAHFEHVEALGYKPKEALEQLIREIAFTHLNRLCAYKRRLLDEKTVLVLKPILDELAPRLNAYLKSIGETQQEAKDN